MHRFLIFMLSLVAVAVPATSWEASTSGNLAINVTAGQAVTALSLSKGTMTGGAPSGTVVGAISVTMSPASPAFSGSLSLSGANASQFQISGANLTTAGVVAAGTYNINIVATETGATGSPFTQPETITGTSSSSTGTSSSSTAQVPGPSVVLYSQNGTSGSPYYVCNTNYYVSTTGNSANNGTSPSSPWDIQTASTKSVGAGSCINVATGLYTIGLMQLAHGGTTASTTGYIAWRCATMPFSFSGGALQGEGAGCRIYSPGQTAIVFNTSYVIWDGFEIIGFDTGNGYSTVGFDNEMGEAWHSPAAAGNYDHIILMNNDIHGFTQSGIQWANQDWVWVIHNLWHDNSFASGNDGSGFSDWDPVGRTGYTPTAQDQLWHSSTDGIQYHVVLAYNVAYHNYNPVAPANSTDGEGIIIDDWGHTQNTCSGLAGTCPYNGAGLVMGNLIYDNGGSGIEAFAWGPATAKLTVANNTMYGNQWNTANASHWGGEAMISYAANQKWINNIMAAANGSNLCWNASTTFGTSACSLLDGNTSGSILQNNVTYTGPVSLVNTADTFPTSGTNANKSGSDPKFNSATWLSTSNNFALQAGSSAIGFGQAFDLWQQSGSVDAGACPSALAHCP